MAKKKQPEWSPSIFIPWICGIYFFHPFQGSNEKRCQAVGIIYMSKHVRNRVSKSMRIKAIYPGSEVLFALWSSLPHSLYLATLTLSSLYSSWARRRSLHSCLLYPSLPLPPPPPPLSLIKGWAEGSRMWQWPPAEACSLILKGRHVGLHPPSLPSGSPKLPPLAWPV